MSQQVRILAFNSSTKRYEPAQINTNGKLLVDTIDVSALATEATLSSLNGKITSCNTSGLATEATLAQIDADTSALSACVSSNKVQVEVATSNKGSRLNVASNETITTLAVSSLAPSVSGFGPNAHLYYEDSTTASTDGIAVEVSINGTDYEHHMDLFPSLNFNGSKRVVSSVVNCSGVLNLRIRNLASVSVSNAVCSVVA